MWQRGSAGWRQLREAIFVERRFLNYRRLAQSGIIAESFSQWNSDAIYQVTYIKSILQ